MSENEQYDARACYNMQRAESPVVNRVYSVYPEYDTDIDPFEGEYESDAPVLRLNDVLLLAIISEGYRANLLPAELMKGDTDNDRGAGAA